METRLYEVPVNYRDDNGKWRPIVAGLSRLPSGALANGANSFDLRLPEDLDKTPVRITLGDEWVSEIPLIVKTSAAKLEPDGTASYLAAGGSSNFEFSGLSNGLKESIKLAGPAAPFLYRFRINASAGVVASLTDGGSIAFRDQKGLLLATMPAPFMVDAAGTQAPLGAVRYHLKDLPDSAPGWKLRVEADPGWLQNKDRSWPVVIDPSVTIPSPSLDCTITSTTETQMCGTTGSPTLTARATYNSRGSDVYTRPLMRFSLSGIPATASLTDASISLYSAKAATNVTKVDLWDVTRAWTSSASWTYASAGVKWSALGGDFDARSTPASISTAERGSQSGPWTFSGAPVVNLVEKWRIARVAHKNENNLGLLIKLADESPRLCCLERRVEWESSAGVTKPKLAVQYILPAPPKSRMASPTNGTTAAKRFRLVAAWDEPIVEGVTFQYKNGNMWSDIPANQVLDKEGQAVSWPYGIPDVDDRESKPLFWDASRLVSGNAGLKIRAVLIGSPGASGYTKPVAVRLDQDLGSASDATAAIGPGSVNLLTGNFTVFRNDVSIPGFESALEFSRSISSRDHSHTEGGDILGGGWNPSAPVEAAGGAGWRSLKFETETEEVEEIVTTNRWATLTHADGHKIRFPIAENGEILPSVDAPGSVLYRLNESQVAFTEPRGNRIVFDKGGASEYLPISVSQPGGPNSKTRYLYVLENGNRLLKQVIAPSDDDLACSDEGATTTKGCRVLEFTYANASVWGGSEGLGKRLSKITYFAPGASGPTVVAAYTYDTAGQLISMKDPRSGLGETYSYESGGQLKTLTPPGQEPWTIVYGKIAGDATGGRLLAVRRATLVSGNPVAQTTIAYGVPLTGAGAPYNMSASEVAKWGQEDLPADSTAIFPPDEVPATPPAGYGHAIVYYMDSEGHEVNVASPAPPGSAGPSISTTETDDHGNIFRELSPQNRLRALAEGSEKSKAKALELDTKFGYSPDGAVLVDERGPVHLVRLENGPEAGTIVSARSFLSIQYDKGAPEPSAGDTWPLLPTSETSGALVSGKVVDQRSVEYRYDWGLRQPIETIVDPEGLNNRSVTQYDREFGEVHEVRQPKDVQTVPGAGSNEIIYYNWENDYEEESASLCRSRIYAGLPCKVMPVAQPSGTPNLPVTRFISYTSLGKPTEVIQEVGSPAATRKTLYTYDAIGRQTSKEIVSGSGTAIPKVETLYDASKGLATTNRFVCPGSEPGCDTQATTTSYDVLGRVTTYQDADGNTTSATYDLDGRVATFNDGKGTQTFQYDAATGLLVGLVDSAAGTFTATYDADGAMTTRGLPNGLTAASTVNAAGEVTRLTYTKSSNCGASCTWLDSEVTRSVGGRILSETGTLGAKSYSYDALGRLTSAAETPAGGGCTTRAYAYDANSNRTSRTTRSPGVGGVCTESGGSTQAYSYDSADRLLGEGLTYDAFGRITNLPASLAGGKALTTSYFTNDMVASQSQNGVTNTYQLDAMLRHRQRLQAGGLEGAEVFHYADPGDSPSWTERGSTWARNIVGIGGELAALQESGKEVTLSLTNLHGDVVATASISPGVTSLKATFAYDEFGNPTSGSAGRFGWLGGMQRPAELPSGIVQMGARSYIPAIGRFSSVDPIAGGSANAYDYANQDPVNSVDLSGLKPYDSAQSGPCRGRIHVWSNKIRSRDGYGKFQMRYGIDCGVPGYHVRVLKIIRRFENLTRNQIELENVNQPARPGSAHYNGFWGNWYDGPSTKFDCVNGQEYQYTYEIVFEYATPIAICKGKDCVGDTGGGGSLALQAQEYCGHGPY